QLSDAGLVVVALPPQELDVVEVILDVFTPLVEHVGVRTTQGRVVAALRAAPLGAHAPSKGLGKIRDVEPGVHLLPTALEQARRGTARDGAVELQGGRVLRCRGARPLLGGARLGETEVRGEPTQRSRLGDLRPPGGEEPSGVPEQPILLGVPALAQTRAAAPEDPPQALETLATLVQGDRELRVSILQERQALVQEGER